MCPRHPNPTTAESGPRPLETARITSLPPSAHYVPNFISEEEEQFIIEKIRSAPKPRWRTLLHRRLQTWPSDLVRDALVEAPLPPFLEFLVPRLLHLPKGNDELNVFAASPHGRPNHVLVNLYPPGSGIAPHKDGAAYYPIVATVSLGSSVCLNIHKNKDDGGIETEPMWRILQEPRSLLITTADLYHDYLHGIADVEEETDLNESTVSNWNLLGKPSAFKDGQITRQTRYSLTYRDVQEISKLTKFGALIKR